MESIHINVTQGKYASAKEARRDGQIPMVYYAKKVEPKHFNVDYQDFRKAYMQAGKSAIITLIDESQEEYSVLIHEIQRAPVSDDIIHVDLMAIKKGQKITTDIPIVFVGESLAVRELAGTFMSSKDKVHIECLPKDLPHEIEVDISPLIDFNVSLTIADIKAPDTIVILDAEDISIATVIAPRAEEEEEVVAPAEGEEGAAEGETTTEEGETTAKEDGTTAEEGENKKEA